MKKHISRIASLCVMLAFLVAALPVASVTAATLTWDNVDENATYASRYYSSYYSNGKFYSNMTKVPLTGDQARDVVAIAASQMGYVEADSSSGQDGETGGSGNYTEYGAFTGVNAAAWCASFCSWCIYTAEVTDNRGTETYMARNGYYWAECYVPYWSNFLYDNGRYRFADYYISSWAPSQAKYVPQPGDLIFFAAGYEPLDEGHIGLVAYSDGTYVYTLEGNTSSQEGVESEGGGAFFKKYALSSSAICGYGILPYQTRDDLPEIDYSGANPTPGLYVTTNDSANVYADRDDNSPTWTLPMSSIFEVSKIEEDNLGNTMLYSKCEINGEIVYGWICMGTANNSWARTFQIYASPVKTLESDVFEVTRDSKIKGISVNTTVEDFLSQVTSEGTIEVKKGETVVPNTANLGTGMTVNVIDNGEVVSSYKVVVKGDVSGDGNISGFDYIKVKRHILNTSTLTDVYYDAGCIVRTEKVTAYDYIMIKRYVLGDITF